MDVLFLQCCAVLSGDIPRKPAEADLLSFPVCVFFADVLHSADGAHCIPPALCAAHRGNRTNGSAGRLTLPAKNLLRIFFPQQHEQGTSRTPGRPLLYDVLM